MNINPGELNKRLEILRAVETIDKDGYKKTELKIFHKCYGKFTRSSGAEIVKAMSEFKEVKTRFLIRYTKKKITCKMLMRYAGEVYNIVYVNDYNDSHQYTEIWCELSIQEGSNDH